jgi:O-antigen ligase
LSRDVLLDRLLALAAGGALLTHALVDWRVRVGTIDPPVSDVFGAVLLVLHGARLATSRVAPSTIGLLPWSVLVVIGLASAALSDSPTESAWFVLRKVIFPYAAWGVVLADTVARVGRPSSWLIVVSIEALAAGVPCGGMSLALWAAGWPSTPEPVPGIVANHKALAIGLAPVVALLWLARPALDARARRLATFAAVFSVVVVALALSRTALATLLAVSPLLVPTSRWRVSPNRLAALAALVLAAMAIVPFVLANPYMQDALASRQSLNLRAWDMCSGAPMLGRGPGSSIGWPVPAADARIAGIDAHGVVQKLASEFGILGLGAWCAFAVALGRRVWPSTRPGTPPLERAAAVAVVALHLNLLLSTETFHAPHWVPLGLALGLLASGRKAAA